MDKEQERLKKEKRKAKAKKGRERIKREKEKKEQWEHEFQENGECCFFAPWWGKLSKIVWMFPFLGGGLYFLFFPNISYWGRGPWLLYVLIFLPSLLVDVKHLFFPVADVVVSEAGILVQSFYGSPGQLYWEELIEFDDGDIVDTSGRNGFFVDGFLFNFKIRGKLLNG